MLQLRSLEDIARADEGWLEARHHFVIGRYRNPGWQGVSIGPFTSFFHERKPTDWVLNMSIRRTTMMGLLLLTAANLFQVVGTYAADWNETHIYNRNWPPHAKFHNAQTMAMAAVLAVASLYFVWRKRGDASTNVLAAAIFSAVYWVTQGLANFYPGVAWTDPEFLKPGQTLKQISPQMILDPIVLGVVFLGWYLARKPAGQTTK